MSGAGRKLAWVAGVVLALAGVARAQAPEDVVVFAAASLQGSLDEVAAAWTQESGQRVVISYAGSAQLARQIERGAPAQVFISADLAWMDHLQQRRLVDAATRTDLLGNRLVIVTGANDPAPTMTPRTALAARLGESGRLAVADTASVPAGRYAKQALQAQDLWDAVAGRLVQADNVRAALAFVARGEVPLGIVYASDARAERRVRVLATFPADTHAPIVYPAARIAGTPAARSDGFLAFLRSPVATCIFVRAGFTMPDGRRCPPSPTPD